MVVCNAGELSLLMRLWPSPHTCHQCAFQSRLSGTSVQATTTLLHSGLLFIEVNLLLLYQDKAKGDKERVEQEKAAMGPELIAQAKAAKAAAKASKGGKGKTTAASAPKDKQTKAGTAASDSSKSAYQVCATTCADSDPADTYYEATPAVSQYTPGHTPSTCPVSQGLCLYL